jgi:hypothetical protein
MKFGRSIQTIPVPGRLVKSFTPTLALAGPTFSVANCMNVEVSDVHHVRALHRHFNVSSRSELLARWVRSGQMEAN